MKNAAPAWRTTGIDLSEKMIETAKKKLAGIRFMACDCENLHFAENSFYAGTCSMSFTITRMHKVFPQPVS